jgi:parallel beta-helix repeat protein
MYKNILVFTIFFLFMCSYLLSETITVTNTYDSGTGSFRQAILDANTNIDEPDSIIFNIPIADPNYVDTSGVWIIRPTSALPIINGNGITIDGRSQAQFIGSDTNPNGPEIVLDGINAGTSDAHGLRISGDWVRIWYLIIHNFPYPNIWIYHGSDFCQVSGCYIGTDVTGMKQAINSVNGLTGITIQGGNYTHIGPIDNSLNGNVISGNNAAEITISNGAHHNAIVGNTIGLSVDRKKGIGFNSYGISIQQYADSNLVADNFIGGNNNGIYLWLYTSDNEIVHNYIGTDESWEADLINSWDGIRLFSGAQNNLIAENIIGKNGRYGIHIEDVTATGNKLTHNRISENGALGIKNITGLILPPIIVQVTTDLVSGTAPANSQVEIYSDPEDEGQFFLGETIADASGNFIWNGNVEGEYITAIAIDTSGNSSEFSSSYNFTDIHKKDNVSIPEKFDLFQNYPNPFNPRTKINYQLPKTNNVALSIYNHLGQKVAVLLSEKQTAGRYQIEWDASEISSGVYYYQLVAEDYREVKKMILLK